MDTVNITNMTNMTKDGCTEMLEDIFKIISYLLITHLLIVIVENKGSIFDDSVLKKMLYASISMVFYHFIIKKILFKKNRINKTNKTNKKKVKRRK